MRADYKSGTIALLVAALLVTLLTSASIAEKPLLRIGLVGMLSPFTGSRQPTSTDELLLSMVCDSLYETGEDGRKITPLLAEAWPSFDRAMGKVTVKLRMQYGTTFGATDYALGIASALNKRIPRGSAASVQVNPADDTLEFFIGEDLSSFWTTFAFAPVWMPGSEGGIIGAGSAPYSIDSYAEYSVILSPRDNEDPIVRITGYSSEAALIDAYVAGEVDYAKTSLSRQAAGARGMSWQSEAPVVVALVFNRSSRLFSDLSTRYAAARSMDVPYLVLRVLQGIANDAIGIYFDVNSSQQIPNGTKSLSGSSISILVDTTDRSSLEMMGSVFVKSWWEENGATVSISAYGTGAELDAAKKAAGSDALVTAIWLQPAFRSLHKPIANSSAGSLTWGGWNDNGRKAAIEVLTSPASYVQMEIAAMELERIMLESYSVVPLIKPLVSELYRPVMLQYVRQVNGEPLLGRLRDLAGGR